MIIPKIQKEGRNQAHRIPPEMIIVNDSRTFWSRFIVSESSRKHLLSVGEMPPHMPRFSGTPSACLPNINKI